MKVLKVSGVSHSLKRLLSLTDPERNRWKLRDKLIHYSRTKTTVANTSYLRCYLSSAVDSSCTHAYLRTYQYQTVCLACLSNNFLSDIDEIIRWLWKEQNNVDRDGGAGGAAGTVAPHFFSNVMSKQLRFKTLALQFPREAYKMLYFYLKPLPPLVIPLRRPCLRLIVKHKNQLPTEVWRDNFYSFIRR